jgi:hypothetical protein
VPEFVTLREYVELLISALEKRILELRTIDATHAAEHRQIALTKLVENAAAAKDAVDRAKLALEKRLEALDAVGALATRVDRMEAIQIGRTGGLRDYVAWILAVVAIAGFVISLIVRR